MKTFAKKIKTPDAQKMDVVEIPSQEKMPELKKPSIKNRRVQLVFKPEDYARINAARPKDFSFNAFVNAVMMQYAEDFEKNHKNDSQRDEQEIIDW